MICFSSSKINQFDLNNIIILLGEEILVLLIDVETTQNYSNRDFSRNRYCTDNDKVLFGFGANEIAFSFHRHSPTFYYRIERYLLFFSLVSSGIRSDYAVLRAFRS